MDKFKLPKSIWKTSEPREQWRIISEFPLYSVSNKQRVKNNKTGRIKKRDRYGAVTLSTGRGHVKRGVLSLYLKAFEGFPDSCRTRIRVIETGEIFFGYRSVCEALGIPYKQHSNIYKSIYMTGYNGEKKKVRGYTFELADEGELN